MPPPLVLRIIGDATGYLKTADATIVANTKIGQSALLAGADFEKSAAAQVAAGVKVIQSQRAQLVELQKIQAASIAGSDRQIAASAAVASAQARLNRSMGITAVATGRAGMSAKEAERDVGKMTRGALAGSGVFSGLGRSLAFASGGFLAIASGAQLLHDSITESITLAATQRQVAAQLKTSGKSWADYGKRIDAVDLRLSHISGFTNQELLQSFGYLVRVTGNVNTALRLNATAVDVARGRHISLSAAAIALGKALGGSTTALKRLGIVVPANVKGMAALNYVAEKFAGQGRAGATAALRFHASLVDTEEIIGTALLPTFDRLITHLGDWLSRMNESGRLQRDVNRAVSDAGTVFHTLGGFIRGVDKVTGSFENTLKILIGLKFAAVIGGWIGKLGKLATALGIVSRAAGGGAGGGGGGGGLAGDLERIGGGAAGGAGVGAAARFARLGSRIEAAAPFAPFVAVVDIAAMTPVQGPKSLQIQGYTSEGQPIALGSDGNYYLVSPRGYRQVSTAQAKSLLASVVAVRGVPVITKALANLPTTGSAIPRALQAPGFGLAGTGQAQSSLGPFGTAQPIIPWAAFKLTMTEQIAQAQAALTKSLADDVKIAREIIDRIKHLIDIGKLQGASLVQGLEAEAAAKATIQQAADARRAAAQARAAARLAAASNYQIPGYLQLAQAKLEAYGKDTTRILKLIIAAAEKAIASGKKNWQGEVAAFNVIAAARSQLQQSVTFQMPPQLALALARDQALGRDTTRDLLRMKAAILKFIRTHRKNIGAITDAYNQLASVNQQLGQGSTNAYGDYRKASTRALTAGLGLTGDALRMFRARLSQIGPGGTTPEKGIGAAGYIIDPATGRPVQRGNMRRRGPIYRGGPGGLPQFNPTIDLNVYIDGKQVEATVTRRQQRRRRHNPTQRRGPNAATATA